MSVDDVFGAPDTTLCHAVGCDLLMSAGVAEEFVRRFGGREEMQAQQAANELDVGDVVLYRHAPSNRLIIGCITKPLSKVKPNPAVYAVDYRRAMVTLERFCVHHNISSVSAPLMGTKP